MKLINANIKTPKKSIEIIPMADLHIGAKECDWDAVRQRIEYIKTTPTAYCILDGDLIDNGTKSSIGDIYSQRLNPGEQLNLITQTLEPIKKKILAAVPGNHEARTWRMDGIDITEQICHRLGIIDRYAPETAVLNLTVNNQRYEIYITHGSGGGRKAGGKINRLIELADVVDADVYIMGHTHQPMVTRAGRVVQADGKLKQKELLFVNLASSLKYGGYGEVQAYMPVSNISPRITLHSDTKFAEAQL